MPSGAKARPTWVVKCAGLSPHPSFRNNLYPFLNQRRHMAIFLPGTAEELELSLEDLTPREIVAELDKHVVGQRAAKRAVAIALRNRMRRQKLPPDLAEEIMPKNIIMIGPTGVGKTEIARRLAKLTNSP